MWLIRLLCCAIVFWRFLHGHTWSHDRKQTLTIGIACFSKTMSRWGIACCGRSLRLRLRLLQLQSHLDSSTKKPDQTKPQETQFETIRNKTLPFWSFFEFCPKFRKSGPVLSCSGSSTRMSCRFWGVFGGETCEVTCKSPWSSEFTVEFLKFHKFWWLFHKAFQNLMSFSKPMGFLPIYFVHGFHFFFALLSRGHRKGRVLRGPMRGPKTPLRHVQI